MGYRYVRSQTGLAYQGVARATSSTMFALFHNYAHLIYQKRFVVDAQASVEIDFRKRSVYRICERHWDKQIYASVNYELRFLIRFRFYA